jgi:predicted enzyme related to lactoylglutathione lyase
VKNENKRAEKSKSGKLKTSSIVSFLQSCRGGGRYLCGVNQNKKEMKNPVVFFEIPSADFRRAVKFYETVLGLKLAVTEYETEKMACFPEGSGSVSWSKDFKPSENGVMVHLRVEDMEWALSTVVAMGGRVTRPKTKIEAEELGFFATFIDSEGNQLGLYSDR